MNKLADKNPAFVPMGIKPITLFDETLDDIRDLRERWNNKFTLKRPFLESYLNGHADIIADMALSTNALWEGHEVVKTYPILIRSKICSFQREVAGFV